MINNMFIEAHIADLHFGALDPNYQYKILKEQFLDKLENMPVLDIVSINGDIFHHKFMANSDAITIGCYFISNLMDICERKNATLIIIEGTYLHDAEQIRLFYPLAERSHADARIIEEAKMEYIKGKNVLCIPEMYGKGKLYYEKALHTTMYDSCYMHGTYVNAIYGKDIPDLDSPREPVFHISDFNACVGPIISGHVHQAGCFDSHFYYTGSPYRWTFGDEGTKGFIFLLQDIKNHYYSVQFEPIISDKYITLNIDTLINGNPNEIIQYIEDRRNIEDIKYIRIEISKNNPSNISIIEKYYRNDKNVSILNKCKNADIVKNMDELTSKYNGYDYLFDANLSPETKLAKYINQYKNDVYITPEDLIQILKTL